LGWLPAAFLSGGYDSVMAVLYLLLRIPLHATAGYVTTRQVPRHRLAARWLLLAGCYLPLATGCWLLAALLAALGSYLVKVNSQLALASLIHKLLWSDHCCIDDMHAGVC